MQDLIGRLVIACHGSVTELYRNELVSSCRNTEATNDFQLTIHAFNWEDSWKFSQYNMIIDTLFLNVYLIFFSNEAISFVCRTKMSSYRVFSSSGGISIVDKG